MSQTEDSLFDIYNTIVKEKLLLEFNKQTKKMEKQNKHQYKSTLEKWEYALYRIRGGKSKNSY
ncbi:MAG: hypothetical protein CMC98_03150 [Flavobacteriales bacterium]|nr:hypothetical protein [Flavobacteriales bacterium]